MYAPGIFATPLGRIVSVVLLLAALIVIVKVIASATWRILSIGLLVALALLVLDVV